MQSKRKEEAQWNCLVGMDAHSEQATLCITEWEFGSEPKVRKQLTAKLADLEETYRRHVTEDSLTVLEASTNAFAIAGRLEGIGQRAAVVCSDTLAGLTRSDKVNDRIDARNLARAWARGGARQVWVPGEESAKMRELYFAYRDAKKGLQAAGSRIWSFCSRLCLPPPRLGEGLAERLAGLASGRFGPQSPWEVRARTLGEEWQRQAELKAHWLERIEAAVAADTGAARLMQVLGIGPLTAFALVAFIGDIRRFPTSSQLVAYVGLNPGVSQSGKDEGKGGLSRHGRRDLRSLLIEGAHSAIVHGKGAMHKWARNLARKDGGGKPGNLALCALARKMLVQVWHILMGHPPLKHAATPNHRRKLATVARSAWRIGALEGIGFAKVKEYVLHLSEETAFPARVRGEPSKGKHPPCAFPRISTSTQILQR